MFRSPRVLAVQLRRELLEEEIGRLQELPYNIWQDLLGRSLIKRARARDGRSYRIRTSAARSTPRSEDIRVIVSLETPALRRRLLRQSFIITPDNRFAE